VLLGNDVKNLESVKKNPLDTSMSWRYVIIKKIINWKIDGRMLCFIESFMKERTLRVAFVNKFSNEAVFENGVVQGAVVSVTLFLIAMSEISDGIQETVKIKG
jgi:hypothetical protein